MISKTRLVGNHTPIIIHEASIKQVRSNKYLGIFIDNTLSWGIRVDTIWSRVQQRLYFMHRLMYMSAKQKETTQEPSTDEVFIDKVSQSNA